MSENDKPLHGARISVFSFKRSFSTNLKGYYHILLFPGEYVVTVNAAGHLPAAKVINFIFV